MRSAPKDVVSETPLERALLCALTCMKSLDFGLDDEPEIALSINRIAEGRLFEKADQQGSKLRVLRGRLASLREGTLYYESKAETSWGPHPLADIWFRVSDTRSWLRWLPGWLQPGKHLVLIDVGGTLKKAQQKKKNKSEQLQQLLDDGEFGTWKVSIIVFAPGAMKDIEVEPVGKQARILTVGASLAKQWLGSWAQILQYVPIQ
mmetsp:Transcript_10197/g.18304  ORF Transcript_10197/g.18304 Transcript_10197/m.18304 type:complete len:205 (+) Transcript_10197:3-617(+)